MDRSKLVRNCMLLLAALALVCPAHARVDKPHPAVDPRNVTLSPLDGPIDLTSTWLTHEGDKSLYADPHFDDSQWVAVHAGDYFKSGKRDVWQAAWYRTHVRLDRGVREPVLLLRWIEGTWTIYVNGVEVGASGPPPPAGDVQSTDESADLRFRIPAAAIGDGNLTIALRQTGVAPIDGRLGRRPVVLLGPGPVLDEYTSLFFFRSLTPSVANFALELLIALIALALALTLRDEREYLALTIFFATTLTIAGLTIATTMGHLRGPFAVFGKLALQFVAVIALTEFVRLVLGMRRSRRFKIFEWMLVVGALAVAALPVMDLVHGYKNVTGVAVLVLLIFAAVGLVAFLFGGTGLPFFSLWYGWKRHNRDAMLLCVPLLLQPMEIVTAVIGRVLGTHHRGLPNPPIQGVYLEWGNAAELLLNLAMLLFLILRTVRIARARAAMATDLHAVQSVQEILLSRASHETPGFRVEHVYYPASEVGGDFFLVSPGPDASLTAVVGDVSGKGLVAAMRVAMILGVLRREEHREPETVLRNLNEALMAQGDLGFTTACCVRLERDGRYTVANAGHISPYVDGNEIETPPSLPLGMDPKQEYEQVSGVLPEGKTMVLMSDGVVEARSAKGELYGFERLGPLTMLNAEDIADVARRFGQEDDITVLTVAWGN